MGLVLVVCNREAGDKLLELVEICFWISNAPEECGYVATSPVSSEMCRSEWWM